MDKPCTVVEQWQDQNWWTTRAVEPRKQFEHWCAFVNQAYLRWSIRPVRCENFPAYIREGRYDGCRITNLTSAQSHIKGTRGAAEIAQDGEALYNLLYIAEGAQHLIINAQAVELPQGHFVLWDTTRPMTFVTGEHLRQITFTLPHDRLHRVLPAASEYVGKPVCAKSGLSRLFAEHLCSLDTHFGDLNRDEAPQILDATIHLLATTLDAGIPLNARKDCRALSRQIQAYINRNLDDPELSLPGIASYHGITVRHLHRLFQDADTTAANWILRRRLDRCMHDLSSPVDAHVSITEVALRWGFSDSSSFSRVFRREFGRSPRDFRAMSARTHHAGSYGGFERTQETS